MKIRLNFRLKKTKETQQWNATCNIGSDSGPEKNCYKWYYCDNWKKLKNGLLIRYKHICMVLILNFLTCGYLFLENT